MERMLDKKRIFFFFFFPKKRIWVIFSLEFKMDYKAAETTCNINNAFGPGTANEWTVQWWFKKFCKGDESLEDEEGSGQPLEVDNNQLRAIIEADLLTTAWEVAEELSIDPMVIGPLKQIGKVKKPNKCWPHELTKKKNFFLKGCLLLFCATATKYFLNRSFCAMKSRLYMTTSEF